MTSAEAAVFKISKSPTVSLEAMIRVHELIEIQNERAKEDIEVKRITLSGKKSNPRKGKKDETTSTLDLGEKSIQSNRNRVENAARGNRNHGRSNSRDHSKKKGGKG